MTHKQQCIANAMQFLTDRSLSEIFSDSIFNHYYRKFKGNERNAWLVGLNAADMMIQNYQPKNFTDESGN